MNKKILCIFLTVVLLASALYMPADAADTNYTWIIQPKFDEIRGFLDDEVVTCIPARQGEKWGLIDIEGNWVVQPKFDDMEWGEFTVDGTGESIATAVNEKWGLIDSTGEWLIEPKFDNLEGGYDKLLPAAINGKYGLIYPTGEWAVQPNFDNLWAGFDLHTVLVPAKINEKWGYIDSTGKWVIEPKFEYANRIFYKKTIAVPVKINGMLGMVDTSGRWVIEPRFDDIDDVIAEGSETVSVQLNDKWGLIDTKGNWVLEPTIIKAENVSGFSMDNVSDASIGDKWGFIDITNTWIIQPQFDSINGWSTDGTAIVEYNGKYGIIHSTDLADASNSYVYDSKDPGSSVELPYEALEDVTDKETAVSAINDAVAALTKEQKASSLGVDSVTLFSEEAIALSSTVSSTASEIKISGTNVAELADRAVDTKEAAVKALSDAGIENNRELNADVKFKTTVDNNVTVTIDKTVADTKADSIRVETPTIAVSVNSKVLETASDDTPLIITISQAVGPTAYDWADSRYEGTLTASVANMLYMAGGTKTYSVSFNKTGLQENIKVSLPKATGDAAYQAVMTTNGEVVGGKYNPATDKLEIRTKTSGQYIVKDNKKDFSDIQGKSKEMQDAINIMTSKGIMGGTTEKQFSPDQPISRAEVASYLLKTFSKLDPNAVSGYSDVKKNDWYYSAAGSAKKYGIIEGFPDNTFKGTMVIPKDQLITVAARTLKAEMKYKDPADIQKYLSTYEDNSAIENWAKTDIAFATRENLVMKRTDNKFLPKKGMTRGDAAIMLKRLFDRVW